MTDSDFAQRLSDMRETMYRVSLAQLPNPHDRDDAVQETLYKAWCSRRKLRDERYMQTWVVRILINECRSIGRRQKREVVGEPPERTEVPQNHSELRDALLRLEEKLRLPVVLHYIEGYHTAEIAQILGIPKGTVLWRMSKARKELAAMLGGNIPSKEQEDASHV